MVARFRPLTDPLSPELIAAVEEHLPDRPTSVPDAGAAPADDLHAATVPPATAPHDAAAEPVGRRGLLSRWARRNRQ